MESFVPQCITEDHGALVLEEDIDMDVLRIIRDNFSEVYKRMDDGFWMFDSNNGNYYETDEKTALSIINELYHSKLKSNKVTYHYTARLKSGRRFAKNSLQGLSRKLRHTIAKSLYYDIDIVNAHPTFLLELCKKLEFKHPILEEYVTNREPLLQSWIGTDAGFLYENDRSTKKKKLVKNIVSDKDSAKKYFLRVINGGGNNKTSNQVLNNFYTRHQDFLDLFYSKAEFKRFRDRAYKKTKKSPENGEDSYENPRGSALNHYLCEVENNIIIMIERYLDDHYIKYGTLCFDGIMVYIKCVPDIKQLLSELEKYLHGLINYNIYLKCKEMNEDINISDLNKKEDIKTTDEDYALLLLQMIDDDFKYDAYQNELWFYNEETALWSRHKSRYLRTLISKYITPYIKTSPDHKIVEEQLEWIKSDSFQLKMVRMCEPYIEKRNDDKFIQEHFDTAVGLFPIADKKVIEFSTGFVRDRLKRDYFTRTTERQIVELTDDIRNEILDYYASMLKTKSIRYRDCLILRMAYILTGENNQKEIINFIGKKNGGKSTYLELHNHIMEDFACWANDRIFTQHKNKSCHDSELFGLRGRRMASVSELSKNEKYNCPLMKKISGNDTVDIRGAGDKRTVNEKFRCILVLATNEMPSFNDPAFADRLKCFNFCNEFEKDSQIVNRLNDLKDHFFTLLSEYAKIYYDNGKKLYSCDELSAYTKKICDEQDSVKWWCSIQNFEPGEYNDFVEKTSLFDRYKTDCEDNRIKNVVGKMDFFNKFREIYNLKEDVKIKYLNKNNNIVIQTRGYRHLKKNDTGENDEDEKESFE